MEAPTVIIKKTGWFILDKKTGKEFEVKSELLYKRFLEKDSGRYVKP